mgnify:CR=1 FL=1
MVAHKVASRVVASDYMPTTAGTLGVSAVFILWSSAMKRASPTRQRLAALGLLGAPLLTYPLLSLPAGSLWGIPASVVLHSV